MTLEILQADGLSDIRHGFFTRRGGASSGVCEGLNCGASSSDQSEAVAMNRAKVAQAMGVPPHMLCTVTQVHGADVVEVSGPDKDLGPTRADAMVTKVPGVALGVLTADCQPVLMADPQAQVIGAAHAGWKGALGGVLEATIDAMEAIGADRSRIIAAIGPSISQRAYEVGPEFVDDLVADDPDNMTFFANGRSDRYMFDLPSYGLKRLRNAGVADASWISHCTYSDPDRFYSYRRSTHQKEADYGRLISVIVL